MHQKSYDISIPVSTTLLEFPTTIAFSALTLLELPWTVFRFPVAQLSNP